MKKEVDYNIPYHLAGKSNLVCEMFGNDCVFHPRKGGEPIWIHRFLQTYLLGFKWIKRSEWESRPYNKNQTLTIMDKAA